MVAIVKRIKTHSLFCQIFLNTHVLPSFMCSFLRYVSQKYRKNCKKSSKKTRENSMNIHPENFQKIQINTV